MASLEFELYGSGDYHTELMQGSTDRCGRRSLPAGEHALEEHCSRGVRPIGAAHPCLVTYEFVSPLMDDQVAAVDVLYNGFVQAEANGGAWLEASCAPVCETGDDGYGYTWFLGRRGSRIR